LNDSDLVAWHSFDGGSHNDSSGNQLNAIQVVDVSSAPGRINEAVNFSLTSSLYEVFSTTTLFSPIDSKIHFKKIIERLALYSRSMYTTEISI
jgi:hypothetical protein